MDLDGNERAAVYLRSAALAAMHFRMKSNARATAAQDILRIIGPHREQWLRIAGELDEELPALKRAALRRQSELPPKRKKLTEEEKRVRSAAVSLRTPLSRVHRISKMVAHRPDSLRR